MKNTTLFFSLFALNFATSTAFAESQEGYVPIDYEVQYRVDGKEIKPSFGRTSLQRADLPIFTELRIGENPKKQESSKLITFFVKPERTKDGLHIKGTFSGVEDDIQESLTIDQDIKQGEDTSFSFNMNGKVYEAVLNVVY